MEEVHKYYCLDCCIYLFGASAARLAIVLNGHNKDHHPTYSDMWTGINIVRSMHYNVTGGDNLVPAVRPAYSTPFAMAEWGNARHEPDITDDDRAMLAKGHVKW